MVCEKRQRNSLVIGPRGKIARKMSLLYIKKVKNEKKTNSKNLWLIKLVLLIKEFVKNNVI